MARYDSDKARSLAHRLKYNDRMELSGPMGRWMARAGADTEVTRVSVHKESDESWAGIAVGRAPGVRCDRCWRYVPAVSSGEARAGLCERCEAALAEAQA